MRSKPQLALDVKAYAERVIQDDLEATLLLSDEPVPPEYMKIYKFWGFKFVLLMATAACDKEDILIPMMQSICMR